MDDFKRPADLQLSKDFGVSLRLQNDGTMGGSTQFAGGATDGFAQLPSGYIIQERYRVISRLGVGGMGSVYRVEHIFLRKEFALKTLNPTNMSEISWRRFQKEAHAANLLDHPSLIKVHDFGIIDGQQPYFVMDYFVGESLSERLKKDGSIPIDEAVDICIEVCNALGYAHDQGVVHRDIKPSNIMLCKDGTGKSEIRIVDFGIAKLGNAEHEQLAMTKTGEIFGTPYYMSPEQCFGKPLDHRADIYSFGCTMFEVLTGVQPFIGDNALTIMMKHQGEAPPSLKEASLGKSFPPDLDKVVSKLLEKTPADRYQNLLDVATDLTKIKSGEKPSIATNRARKGTKKKTAERTDVDINTRSAPIKTLTLALLTLIICGVAAAFFFFSTREKQPAPPALEAIASAVQSQPIHKSAQTGERTTQVESAWKGAYFSEDASESRRVFHFPGNLEECPGRITGLGTEIEMRCTDEDGKPLSTVGFAAGRVVIEPFTAFRLNATDYLCTHPEMLNRFRSDELNALRLNNVTTVSDDTLKYVGRLTGLKELELDECVNVTDKSVPYFDSLPNLEVLILGRTHCTGDKVAALKRLRDLKMLDLRCMQHGLLVVQKLKGSQNLHYLGLRLVDVSDEDMSLLAGMTNLTKVDLSATHITDSGFERLTKLHNLTELDVSDCQFSNKIIPMFENFPNLRHLKIDAPAKLNWSYKDCKAFDHSLPDGCVVIDPDTRKSYTIKR